MATTVLSPWSPTRSFKAVSPPFQGLQQAKLVANDRDYNDLFSYSVSISGDGNYVAIGAPSEGSGGYNPGAVYVYKKTGSSWDLAIKHVPADTVNTQSFGCSVAFDYDGNTLAIGAETTSVTGTNAGAAYVYLRSGTEWTGRLLANGQAGNNRFGTSVTVDDGGDNIVVGSNDGANRTGAGYFEIFTKSSTWASQGQTVAPESNVTSGFACSLSISPDGSILAVGSQNLNGGQGAVFIYTKSGSVWSQTAKITPPVFQGRFGWDVDLNTDGTTLVVSAYGEDIPELDSGAVYIYSRSGTSWTFVQKLVAPEVVRDHYYFGKSVSISGNGRYILVGTDVTTNHAVPGFFYVYKFDGSSWVQVAKPSGVPSVQTDNTARYVEISTNGQSAIVSSENDRNGGSINGGAAYIFI